MNYFATLKLNFLEAYASFLRSRYTSKVAYYQSVLTPTESKIALLRTQLNIEASNGVVFDGRSFHSAPIAIAAPAPSTEPVEELVEAEVEAPAPAESEVVAEADAVEPESKEAELPEQAVMKFHPELGGESIVFEDEHVKLLETLEQEFNPNFLASSEFAMKTLDRTKMVVSTENLNVKDHIGMLITPIMENPEAQKDEMSWYFVASYSLPEELSMQISHGKTRELVKIMVISVDTEAISAVVVSPSSRWIVESRRL